MELFKHTLKHSFVIAYFIFVMMMLVDYLNVFTKGKLGNIMKGGMIRQYIIAALLGLVPGCLGAFLVISFYTRHMISFGAVLTCLIATTGDEAFIMLSMFPSQAIILFGILFFLSLLVGFVMDKFLPLVKMQLCEECDLVHPDKHDDECRCLSFQEMIEHLKHISLVRFLLLLLLTGVMYALFTGLIDVHDGGWEQISLIILSFLSLYIIISVPDHYLNRHIWEHIIKAHLWKIILWSFMALLIIDIGLEYLDLQKFIESNKLYIFLIAGLVGMIPISGPHLVFIIMFAKGIIPFSILLTSSIVQDGHGLLPLMPFSLKDTLLFKLIKFAIGIGAGAAFYLAGY